MSLKTNKCLRRQLVTSIVAMRGRQAVFFAPTPVGIPGNPRENRSLLLFPHVQTQNATASDYRDQLTVPGILRHKEHCLCSRLIRSPPMGTANTF